MDEAAFDELAKAALAARDDPAYPMAKEGTFKPTDEQKAELARQALAVSRRNATVCGLVYPRSPRLKDSLLMPLSRCNLSGRQQTFGQADRLRSQQGAARAAHEDGATGQQGEHHVQIVLVRPVHGGETAAGKHGHARRQQTQGCQPQRTYR